jgi:hypothetical protein
MVQQLRMSVAVSTQSHARAPKQETAVLLPGLGYDCARVSKRCDSRALATALHDMLTVLMSIIKF